MSGDRVRVAQVGVGGMGLAHVRAVAASTRATMVGVCDVSEAAVAAAQAVAPAPAFDSLDELLATAQPDALILVLPHDLYPAAVALAAEHRVAVLKEKPFARNLADAEAMHRAVTSAGIPFLCGAQRQFAKPFAEARRLLDEGAVGDVFLTQGAIFYPWQLDSTRWSWRGERERSGGIAVVDSGWHSLDAIVWLKGLPTSVYCRTGSMRAADGPYEVDDKAVVVFDFADGSIGSMSACYVTVPSRYELRLHGTQGTLDLTPERLRLHPRPSGAVTEVLDDGADVIAAQFEHFLDVLLAGARPRVGIEEALRLQRVVEAAYQSAASGQRVDLQW